MQASPFLPLMFIASEPQTPSRQLRRKRQRVVDRLHPDQRVEQHPVVRIERDVVVLMVGLRVLLGIVAVDAEFHGRPSALSKCGSSAETLPPTPAS